MKRILFILFFLNLTTQLFSKETYIYSTVSLGTKENTFINNQPLINYLASKLNREIKIRYIENHKELLNEFVKGNVDIAHLGPVPFIVLKNKYKHYEPIAMVNEKDGSYYYRCIFFTTIDKEMGIKQVKKVAMTNPLSTCGYTFVYNVFKKNKLNIENVKYEYIGNHEDVIQKVLAGFYDAGGVKESVFEQYRNLGLKSLYISDELPAFLIIANAKTVSKKDIETIKMSLFNMKKDEVDKLKLGKYGFSPFDKQKYDNFESLINNDILKKIYE